MKNNSSYRYILRYYIDPGFHEEDRTAELIKFCHDSCVEEVMLFYNPEELFAGFQEEPAIEEWLVVARKIVGALKENDIAVSLNPWTTTVHLSRGRYLSDRFKHYRTMTGETGTVAPISCCPLDENWQQDLCDLFSKFCKELDPCALWIEDDWRLHNHEADMNYGGCFCEEHIRRFGEAIGRETTREELLSEILGKNNLEWRKKWIQLSQDTLVEPAEKLYSSIHIANPATKLGLMSSVPDTQAAEGRDWNRLKRAFSPDEPMLLRPHLPPYTEDNSLLNFPAVTRQTVAEYNPEDIEIYPELENSPRSGPYSKSMAYSAFECLASPLYGSQGITINHYDMMGNGIALDRRFGTMLKKIKRRLDALVACGCCELDQQGVDVLFSSEVSASMESTSDFSLFGIVNNSVAWSRTFGILGISHRLTAEYDPDRVTAVSGQTLSAYSDDEIMEMLEGRLILDGPSTELLVRRGFGKYIGVKEIELRTLQQDGYGYEQVNSTDAESYGLEYPRMSANRCALELYAITPDEETVELSTIFRYDKSRLYPGLLSYINDLGGSIVSCAWPLETGQFYMGYFNNFRRIFMQRIIGVLAEGDDIAMGLDLPLNVYRCLTSEYDIIAILNPLRDDAEKITFAAGNFPGDDAEFLDIDGQWKSAALIPAGEDCWTYNKPLESLDALYLRINN